MSKANGRKDVKVIAEPIAGDAAQGSDDCYQVLFQKSPAIIHCSDQDGRIINVSDGWLWAFGYKRDEVIGQNADKFMSAEMRDTLKEGVRKKMAEDGHVRDHPVQVLTKSGEVCDMLLSAVLQSNPENKQIRTLGVLTDAGDRRRYEEALEESEERFRRLASASSEGIAIHQDGRILYANEALARMYGYELSEVIGTHVKSYAAPDSRELVMERSSSEAEDAYAANGSRKDGSIFPVEIRGKSVRYHGRKARITVIRDTRQPNTKGKGANHTGHSLPASREPVRFLQNSYPLTARELSVLQLVAAGKTDKDIAGVLTISPLTVHKHVANILSKMNAASRTEAGVRALREGLLD